MTPTPLELLDALVAHAAADLQGADAGAPVCATDRRNRSVAAVKRAEGRWAALRGAQRQIGRGAEPGAALQDAHLRWQADLARHLAKDSGREWVAYCRGGVEALEELMESAPGRDPGVEQAITAAGTQQTVVVDQKS